MPDTTTASAGLTPAAVTTTSASTTTAVGDAYTYQVVIQVPVPFLNLNIESLGGSWLLPTFTQLTVPKAMLNLLANVRDIYKTVVEDAQTLVQAIPEATVNVVVRVGQMTILNIILAAKKTPVVVTPPNFELALPNLAVDGNLNFSIPFPVGEPIVVEVPIPYPVFNPIPLITVSGGQTSIVAGTSVSEGDLGAQASGSTSSTPYAAAAGTSIDSIFGAAGAGAAAVSSTTTNVGTAWTTTEGSGSAGTSSTTEGESVAGADAVAYPQDIENWVSMPSI